MFYFDSKTTRSIVSLYCAALVFQKAYIDRMLFGYADCKSNKHGPRAAVSIFVHRRKSRDRFRINFDCVYPDTITYSRYRKVTSREDIACTKFVIILYTLIFLVCYIYMTSLIPQPYQIYAYHFDVQYTSTRVHCKLYFINNEGTSAYY